jgi:WD40 repeat protein
VVEKEKTKFIDPKEMAELANAHPDLYWNNLSLKNSKDAMIFDINADHPLELIKHADIRDNGLILGMTLSSDGTMLATFSNMGSCLIWDLGTFTQIAALKDEQVIFNVIDFSRKKTLMNFIAEFLVLMAPKSLLEEN